MTNLDRCYNIFDLREAAQRRLPKGIFEYVDKGTEDGQAADTVGERVLDHDHQGDPAAVESGDERRRPQGSVERQRPDDQSPGKVE